MAWMPKRTATSTADDRTLALRALTRSKLHIVPGTLARLSSPAADSFDGAWAPVRALSGQLGGLAAGLLWYWAHHERGHVLIGPSDGGYQPGPCRCGRRLLEGVAFVSAADLATTSRRPLGLVAHLLDHLLGCGGSVDGPWLSDGGGATPVLQEVGRQVHDLFALGYGRSEEAQGDARVYLAEALVDYCLDRKALNVADPRMERLLRRTLMNEAFWRAKTEDG
jgi:hypothetical protein